MAADYDEYLEQQRAERYDEQKRAERYDGGDEDERGNEEEEEQDEQGERADEVARLYSEGHERRAQVEMDAEDDERCLKSYMEVL